jgi:hypothetical protein
MHESVLKRLHYMSELNAISCGIRPQGNIESEQTLVNSK